MRALLLAIFAGLAAWLPAVPSVAASQSASAPPAAAVIPASAPAFSARLNELVAYLGGKGSYPALFAPVFRQAVSEAQFGVYASQLRTSGGAVGAIESITPVTAWSASVRLGYARQIATIRLAVDPAKPNQIVGLRFVGTEPRDDSVAKLEVDFATLAGDSGFGIYALGDDGSVTPLVEVNARAAAPLGSAFKLWILAEAAKQVLQGKRHWDDVVRVGRPSLPSGILQKWPAHAPVTLQTLATLMISISDNSAADTLLTLLGPDAVGNMVHTIGIAEPNRTLPILSTMQAFELKSPTNKALADAWAGASPVARSTLLAANTAHFTATPIDPHMFDSKPLEIDTIEWFASPRDMALTLDWLRLHGDQTTHAILGINPGTTAAVITHFDYVGFKGGSEPGVITLNFLVQTHHGQWLAITGNWHNAAAAVSELTFSSLMNRALLLAATMAQQTRQSH